MNLTVFITILLAFSISLFLCFYLVPLLIKVANKLNIVDKPDMKLKQQKQAVPYLGGLAVYISFIASLALIFPFENRIFLFLVGSTLLLFVGLIDDLIEITPFQKIIGQILATFCYLKAGFYLKEQFFSYGPNILISFFWILSVINAFNLVDVMDGLSTSLAAMATLSFLFCALIFESYSCALLLSSFLGSLVAFWWYNRPSAQIYLGDAGSLFIGGFLAAVPFLLPWGTYSYYGYITPVVILLIPLLELSTLILIRTYKKIPFYLGSPDHFCIYFQQAGWSKYDILAYVILFSNILTIIAIAFMLNMCSLLALVVFLTLLIIWWYFLLILKKNKIHS